MEDKELKAMRKYREEKFYATAEKLKDQYLYDNELILSVSHNGYQSSSISLSPRETKKVIKVLTMYLKSIK
ncbi:MAG: hypothetical protein ACP5N7_00240 [Candidatus Pacearchaeota archaeon]